MPELPAHTRIDWQPILNLLDQFRHEFADCPPLDLRLITDRLWSDEDYKAWSLRTLAARQSPGVYLLFDEHGCLIYVGKASTNSSLDARMWSHDQSARFTDRPRRWTYVIPFGEDDDSPKVTMLEELLIKRLQPIHNVVGK